MSPAATAWAAGDMSYAVGGGVEVMTRVPMFSGIGGIENLNPALFDKYELIHQGESAERVADRYNLSRNLLDGLGHRSHLRATKAATDGYFQTQLAPIQGLDADGNTTVLDRDEGVRPNANLQKMGQLPTPFRGDGVITAGNSSLISDGAAALLIADRRTAAADGFRPRARFLSRVVVGDDAGEEAGTGPEAVCFGGPPVGNEKGGRAVRYLAGVPRGDDSVSAEGSRKLSHLLEVCVGADAFVAI